MTIMSYGNASYFTAQYHARSREHYVLYSTRGHTSIALLNIVVSMVKCFLTS